MLIMARLLVLAGRLISNPLFRRGVRRARLAGAHWLSGGFWHDGVCCPLRLAAIGLVWAWS